MPKGVYTRVGRGLGPFRTRKLEGLRSGPVASTVRDERAECDLSRQAGSGDVRSSFGGGRTMPPGGGR